MSDISKAAFEHRPRGESSSKPGPDQRGSRKPKVLVVGVCLADLPNLAAEITENLRKSVEFDVDVNWAILTDRDLEDGDCEKPILHAKEGDKFRMLNSLLSSYELKDYEYLVVVDDDVALDEGWLDQYLTLQRLAGLDVCAPARSTSSNLSHPFTLEIRGIQARKTQFVEIGPVFSLNSSAVQHILPFDENFPMGWGLEVTWKEICNGASLSMGIIDAFVVEHALRPSVSTYDRESTLLGMTEALSSRNVLDVFQGQRILSVFSDNCWQDIFDHSEDITIDLSIVICTWNRQNEVERVLQSLLDQEPNQYEIEIIIVDDGSSSTYVDVVEKFRDKLRVHLARKEHSGIASSRNLGLFLARGPIVLFQDDDDYLSGDFVSKLIDAHTKWHHDEIAILNHTELSDELKGDYLALHATTSRGGGIYNYEGFRDKIELSALEFWGGRVSVKRKFLLKNGVFNPEFAFGFEDSDLGLRLKAQGMRVFYSPEAISVSFRAFNLESYLNRAYNLGKGLAKYVNETPGEPPLLRLHLFVFDHQFNLSEEILKSLIRTASSALEHADYLLRNGLQTDQSFYDGLDGTLTFLRRSSFQRGFLHGVQSLSQRPSPIGIPQKPVH